MHGQRKLSNEGYRTRDGHFIEWFGRLLDGRGPVVVRSRPEPQALRPFRKPGTLAGNTRSLDSWSWRIPTKGPRQRWWWTSRDSYSGEDLQSSVPVVIWNPFVSVSNVWDAVASRDRKVAFDMLDDWTNHYAFDVIRSEVRLAYQRLFDRVDIVTANSEATLATAQAFGRSDAQLVTNGCDPDRFPVDSLASGPITVGYVGKIGKRVDLELVLRTAAAFPDVSFVFAGPILDREYDAPLRSQPNIRLLGDVHYDRVPALLQTFDIGWVPHRVGEGEVGGDVIKTYEYRAAGLPVITTPVLGANDRGLDGVRVASREEQEAVFAAIIARGSRVPRESTTIPPATTWRFKAVGLLDRLGVDHV
jgi:glycosyltransferase involved in cell wall biosynthesis